jgi:hypothetical protein
MENGMERNCTSATIWYSTDDEISDIKIAVFYKDDDVHMPCEKRSRQRRIITAGHSASPQKVLGK